MKNFVNGMRIFAPKENTPDFVKFSGIITKAEMIAFLKDKGEQVRFQVKESKGGAFYAEVDTWEPTKR